MIDDFRGAVRELFRSWQATAAILVMLALGAVASSTAIFLMTTLLANPLDVGAPEQLVALRGALPSLSGKLASAKSFLDYRPLLRGAARAAAYSDHDGGVNVAIDERVLRARGAEVTAGFFDTLGKPMRSGRGFVEEEQQQGRNRVVVLSDALSTQVFGRATDPHGRTLRLNDVPFTVIGVAHPDLRFPRGAEFWIPVSIGPDRIFTGPAIGYSVFARLDAGTTLRGFQRNLTGFVAEAERQHPGSWPSRRTIEVVPLADEVVGSSRLALQILAVALAVVWIATAANIAAMLLARADAREEEMAVRWALGASPRRFVRQFMAEAALLGTAAVGCSVAAAFLGLPLVVRFLPEGYGGGHAPWPAASTLSLALVLSLLTGALSVLPGLRRALRSAPRDTMLRRGPSSRQTQSRRSIFVVSQLAAAMVLVSGTVVLGRSLLHLQQTDLGFDPGGTIAVSVSPPSATLQSRAPGPAFYDEVLDRIGSLAGVRATGATTALPLGKSDAIALLYSVVGMPTRGSFRDQFALTTAVTTDYFRAMGIAVVEGRGFSDRDTVNARPVLMVNRSLAHRYGGPAALVGREVTLAGRETPALVVGVVEDVRHMGATFEAGQQIFLPHSQMPALLTTIVVRTDGNPLRLVPDLRRIVAGIAPGVAVYDVATLEQLVRDSTRTQRLVSSVLAAFAMIALGLAAVGAFAAMTQFVAARRREIGVRMALGASTRDVARLVLGRAAMLAALGIACGATLAYVALRLVSNSVFGVLASAPGEYGIAAMVLFTTAAAACAAPTFAAVRIEPAIMLRND
jgi:predicted permease